MKKFVKFEFSIYACRDTAQKNLNKQPVELFTREKGITSLWSLNRGVQSESESPGVMALAVLAWSRSHNDS